MARKASRPPSWLTVLQNARTVFVGKAVVTEDVSVPATQTSFRGAGYRVVAKISLQQLIIGSLPDGMIELQGETQLSPEARLKSHSALFPPDNLHRIDYWDYAQADIAQFVLVVLSEPTMIRILDSLEDDLPDAVQFVHSWLQLAEQEQKTTILEGLSRSTFDPVAYSAGFELLMAQKPDLPLLFKSFNNLSHRPGTAIQAIVDQLYQAALTLSEPEIKALSRALLDGWATESDPGALASYLIWFEAHKQRTWWSDSSLRRAVLAEAERAKTISFSGANANQWEQRVHYYASVLMDNASG